MNLTLIRKEIVEHGWVLLVLLMFTVLGFALALLSSHLNQAGSLFEAVRFYALSLLVLLEMVLCNRLVVQEYTKKTQLFLEGLPVTRSAMLATKYFFGLGLVVTMTGGCLLLTMLIAGRQEPVELRFAAILASRLFAFVFSSYSFFFMMGLLGRYRIGIYLGLILLTMILAQSTSLDLSSQGPWALLDSQFAYERQIFPATNLWLSVATGSICVVVAMLLGIVREGTVAGMLAEKMSYREKVFITAAILSLMWAGSTLDEKKTPDPYTIIDAVIRKHEQFEVQVEPIVDGDRANQLADQAFEDLSKIRDYLGIVNPTGLFLVNRSDLDADQFEVAQLKNASGMLIRVNYGSDNWSYDRFRAFLIDAYLSESTDYTVIHEPHCWVVEGFSEYWPRREEFDQEWNVDAKPDLRAAYSMMLGIEKADIRNWYTFRERHGQPIIRSVACSGLVLAERKYGREKVTFFLQEYLSGKVAGDFRADIANATRPIHVVWQETFGTNYSDFQDEWLDELQKLTKRWNDRLKSAPQLSATSSLKAESELSYTVTITPTQKIQQPTPQADVKIEVLYEEITPYDAWREDKDAKSQVEPFAANEPIVLFPTFNKGDRIRWTTKVFAPMLECDVISGWKREEVR